MEDLVEQIPTKEFLFVLMDTNARTGQRVVGCGDDESRGLGAYGRDVLNASGKQPIAFATICKLPLTHICFNTRKGGISHTHNGTSPNDRMRVDCIMTRHAHRPDDHDVKVVPGSLPPCDIGFMSVISIGPPQ